MGKAQASRPFASLMGLGRGSGASRGQSERDATLARCAALADGSEVDPQVALRNGRLALLRHPDDVEVQVAVGRLFLAAGQLEAALQALSSAARADAAPRTYRMLGETLLRLGDAQVAKPMLKRAIEGGEDTPATRDWYASAKAYVAVQAEHGCDRVARDVAAALRAVGPRRADGAPPAPSAPARDREPSLPRFPLDELAAPELAQPPLPRFTAAEAPEHTAPTLPTHDDTETDLSSVCPPTRTRSDAPCTIDLAALAEVDFDLDRDELKADELVSEDPAPAAPPSHRVDNTLWESNIEVRPTWQPRALAGRSSKARSWKRARPPLIVAVILSGLCLTLAYARLGGRTDAATPVAEHSAAQAAEPEPAPPAALEPPAPVVTPPEAAVVSPAASVTSAPAATAKASTPRPATHSKPAAPRPSAAPAPRSAPPAPRTTAPAAPKGGKPVKSIWAGDPEGGGS